MEAAALTAKVAPAAAAAVPAFQVSNADIDITPSIGYPMAGYGVDSPRLSEDVNEPLRARCTVLWDSGAPNVIVTADVLAFGRTMHQQIRAGVVDLGVGNSDFVLTATHTHNGPVLIEKLDPYIAYNMSDQTEISEYSSWLVQALIDLVADALAAPRTTCTLEYYLLDENFSINRTGFAHQETAVPTLVARDLAGNPCSVLFGYGTHPVAAGGQVSFDPDYPSEAIKTIEAYLPGCFAQFLTGAAGDQNPATTESFEQSDAYGQDLGLTVVNAVELPGRSISGPISTSYSEVQLPLDITLTDENIKAVANAFAARATRPNDPPYPGWVIRHASVSAAYLRSKPPLDSLETSIPLPIQSWKFGGLRILFTGGELVSGYAEYFRNVFGTENVWINAYSNEVPAYIPSDEILRAAGYEAGYDADAPGIGGGSMGVYNHIAHFRGKPTSTSPDGVEQLLIASALSIL